jgi:hypothetical protein
MATSMFFCSQCSELKGIEKESCGREKKIEKVWRRCKISHKTIWLSSIPRKYLPRSYVGFPVPGDMTSVVKSDAFSYFKVPLTLLTFFFVTTRGLLCFQRRLLAPRLSESPRFKQFFSRFCRFYDPSVTKEGDPQHVPKALRVNQDPPEHHACRNGS